MSSLVYIIAEGILDVVFISQVLRESFGGRIIQQKSGLPAQARAWLDMCKWPVGDDITRRSVPAPAFAQLQNILVALRSAQGVNNIQKTIIADREVFHRLRWRATEKSYSF